MSDEARPSEATTTPETLDPPVAPARDGDGPDDERALRRKAVRRRWRWLIRLSLFTGVTGYLLIFGCDSLFYHPSDTRYYRADEFHLESQDVHFKTSDGLTLHGWFLPAQRPAPRGTVIHFHGNAANITNHIALVAWLPHAGYHVLMFDYRGYGDSQGSPTRAGTTLDGLAAVDYMLTRPEYEPGRLFAYGQSLGGAVATVVAAKRDEIRALVLEATFGDYRCIAARHARKLVYFDWSARLVARLLISDGHDPVDVVSAIAPRPLLVIAGGADRICPADLGRELFDVAGEPKEWVRVDGADHFEALDRGGSDLEQRIVATFERGAGGGAP